MDPPKAGVNVGVLVPVLVPDASNLQFLAFWIAQGAGYFHDQGIDVALKVPPSPALAQSSFQNGAAPFAVLPAPDFERLIAEQLPIELVANLLANDPIDLVMKRETAEARGIRLAEPLRTRLERMKGLTIGVAPNPRTRFDALLHSQGLDAASLVHVEVLRGEEQNDALESGEVDALYAHTPYLERALLEGKSVLVVDQAGGEIPELADRQIHALVVKRAFAEKEPGVVAGMVRAIARAEALVHAKPEAATDAILRAVNRYDREHVAKLVALYARAVPATPTVSARKIARELAYYPATGSPPDLSKVDLERFVRRASSGKDDRRPGGGLLLALVAVAALLAAVAAVLADARKS